MSTTNLINLFTSACSINSPSGDEREFALWIKMMFSDTDWQLWTDDVHKKIGGNTGNLYAYLEVNPAYETTVFSAHIDTVAKKGDKINVKFDGKIFKSDEKTILGADNRAGVVPLLNLALNIDKNRLNNNILLYFPIREEAGEMGSLYFEFKKSKVKYVFNIDGGDVVGSFVYKSLGFINFKVQFRGLAAHAAKEYSKGKNAILAATKLVSKLPLGKNEKEGTTLNVGSIRGGGATNIVPDFVELEGEFRAFEEQKMEKFPDYLSEQCETISKETGVTFKVLANTDKSYAKPFLGAADSEICKICKKVSEKMGIKPTFGIAYYTSDANNFSGKGLETVVVSRGGKNAHSKDEQISLKDLELASKMVQELAYTS